jgi:hypothetical protein
MILRHLSEHVKSQNWFAVAIDFAIVVFGVFIGIQVANWNDEQAFKAKEIELLGELRRELQASIRVTNQKRDAIIQVTSAGTRSLEFMNSGASCGSECWQVLVDFLHASQWQPIDVNRSTYDEMRRQGLPRSREIIDAVEGYLAQNINLAATHFLPAYRSLVRQQISVEAQSHYWLKCYDLKDGAETYALDCPKGVADEVSARIIDKIVSNPGIEPHLTEWIGINSATPPDLAQQNMAAERAITAIDKELEQYQ